MLEIDEKKIEERMNGVKPFEEVYKRMLSAAQEEAGEDGEVQIESVDYPSRPEAPKEEETKK